jgi:hypothetical protein
MDHLDIEALVVALDSDLDSELNRLTRVPLGQARAAVRLSALGVTVISHRLGMECAESFNPCAARLGPRRRALERVGRDRWFDPTRHRIQ